jgi:hypothetical protein
MIIRFVIWLEDTCDELVHNHVLRLVWKFPVWLHEFLLKSTGYRLVQFLSMDNIPYRWELHKEYPSYPNLAFKQQSRVDKEPEPKTILEVLSDLEMRIKEENYPSPIYYEIWHREK